MIPSVIVAVSLIASAVVGTVVAYQQIRSPKHQLFGLLTLTFIAFSLFNFVSLDVNRDQLSLMRLVMATSSLIVFICFLFVTSLRRNELEVTPLAAWLGLATAIVVPLGMTPAVISDYVPGSPPTPVVGLGIIIYAVHLMALLYLSVHLLLETIKKSKGREKSRLKTILLGIIPSMVLAPITGMFLPAILHMPDLVVLSPVYTVFFVICVGYAIVRYGLFDIKTAIIRSTAYFLVLATLTIIYYIAAYTLSIFIFGGDVSSQMSISPINVGLALVLAFLFQPIKKFFDKLTNGLFYKQIYDSSTFYSELNNLVRSTVNLKYLLRKASALIKSNLKSESVSFFIYVSDSSVISIGTEGYKKVPLKDLHVFDDLRKPQSVDDYDLSEGLRRVMVSHSLSIVVPLYHNDEPVGVMCLGDHLTSRYSKQDFKTLKTAAGELVIGIQNALSVQEIRDLNDNLQHRIDSATKELRRSNAQLQKLDEAKDEFMGMASHQLRTPLTSIKGYLSMLLDEDLGKINKQQEHVIQEAFTSSERMVRLIADFLNVSRLQTGKFVIDKHPVDLAVLVEKEISALQQTASGRGLKFIYKKPANIPIIDLDENKIQQVVMNFIDNAIYYSKDGGTIRVSLKKTADRIELKVKDTGIGVPEAEQGGLFSKFFRASNARQQRPDGTGVGLFLAKKVVKDHGGEIIFNSKQGRGSTFGFSLPVRKTKS